MKRFITIFCFISVLSAGAQDTLVITLNEAIELAHSGSIASKQIKNSFQSSYWAYKAYKAGRLPNINLSSTLPNFNRSVNDQVQPDGTRDFVFSNVFSSSVGLEVSQPVTASGGSVFMNSGLQRIDNVDKKNGTSYSASPVSVGFRQDLFSFNSYRWDKKTEPMKYEQASRDKVEKMEQLTTNVVQVFFNFLLSQENLKIATKNYKNNEELYQIAKGRYELGKIAENDLLQMELSVLQASNSLETSKIQLRRSKNDLFVLLSIETFDAIRLVIPFEVPELNVDQDIAYREARKNRKDVIGFELQKIQADIKVAQAKVSRKPQLSVSGSFGLNNRATQIKNSYIGILDQQQRFNFGIAMPIYDGGQRRSQYKIAVSEQELIYADIQQQELAFEREVRLKAIEMNVLKDRLYIAAKSDTIAEKRYDITRQRYLIGKIDITELNLALNSKDQSRRAYLQSLMEYWQAYYNLRQLTLYDFETNTPLYKPEETD